MTKSVEGLSAEGTGEFRNDKNRLDVNCFLNPAITSPIPSLTQKQPSFFSPHACENYTFFNFLRSYKAKSLLLYAYYSYSSDLYYTRIPLSALKSLKKCGLSPSMEFKCVKKGWRIKSGI